MREKSNAGPLTVIPDGLICDRILLITQKVPEVKIPPDASGTEYTHENPGGSSTGTPLIIGVSFKTFFLIILKPKAE